MSGEFEDTHKFLRIFDEKIEDFHPFLAQIEEASENSHIAFVRAAQKKGA